MFIGRQYKRVSQQGDSDTDTTDNETAFFTNENGAKKWRMGMSPGNLNEDPEFVHPTLPVETKKKKLSGHYTRRQFISGVCLLLVILAMVAAFSATIILGQKFMIEEAPPPNDHNNIPLATMHATDMPAPTPLVNFDPTDGNELTSDKGDAPIHQYPTRYTTSHTTIKSSLLLSPTPSFTVTMSSPVHTSTPIATLKMAADTERTNVASDTEGRKLNPLTQLHYDRGQDTIHVYSDEQESY